MKKTVLTLALAGVLVVGATVLASADETTTTCERRENVQGVSKVQELVNNGASFEDAKAQMTEEKYNKIDEAVKSDRMTEERAAELKQQIQERSESCTTLGENRGENHERMGLGLGKGKGNGNGMRNGNCNK